MILNKIYGVSHRASPKDTSLFIDGNHDVVVFYFPLIGDFESLFKEYLIQNFNSKNTPGLFKRGEEIGFKNLLKFNDASIHTEEEYVLTNLKRHGIYKLSPKFENDPSLETVLLLGPSINRYQHFWDKLQKELIELEFTPKLNNVVKIEKIARIEIEKKVKAIETEQCDIVIAILPETSNQDRVYELFRSSLFNFNLIKSQFIFEKTIGEKLKWALANVLLGILAKTGNIPYILASPLDFADYFVGIDISREQKKSLKGSQNYAATARFYGKDGTFKHYEIQEDKIEGETLPKIILERIFAKSMFQGKAIMIHRDGYFRGGELSYLKELGEKYDIKFQFVEVLVEGLEDKAALNALDHQLHESNFEKSGTVIIPVLGKRNLDRPVLIFKELDIPTYIIFDTDSDKRGDDLESHKKCNIALRRIMGDDDIQDPAKSLYVELKNILSI